MADGTSNRAAMILMLGSGGSNALTKGVAKWLEKQDISVRCVGPDKGVAGYHNFPLERVETAIAELKAQGKRKFGILGASITTIPALMAASRFHDITLTIAVSPCDFVLQGFAQGRRDGCREWPVTGESMMTYRGAMLPCVPYGYQHPDYWRVVRRETKGSGNILSARKVFEETENRTPLTPEVMIPAEDICGRLMLIGCADDCLRPTERYIRRMENRINSRAHTFNLDALVYEHGTHYAFPESLLKAMLPIGADFLIGSAFKAAREYPRECLNTRLDIDRRMKQAIREWSK